MIWFFYNICFALIYPLLLPWYFLRMFRRGGYSKNFFQRIGVYSSSAKSGFGGKPRIWIHAVSVGEMFVALQLKEKIRELKNDVSFVITTTTSTGHAIAEKRLVAGDMLAYFPIDLPVIMNRVFDLFNPVAIVLIENELWPNLLRTARARDIPVTLANGRISEKSYRGYMKLRPLVGRALAMLDLMLVQGEADAARLKSLNADPARIRVLGSAKYDEAEALTSETMSATNLLAKAGITSDMPVIVAGSTWPGEEAIMIAVLKKVLQTFPDTALVIAPRHVERAPEIVALLETSGMPYIKRSNLDKHPPNSPVKILLVDTTGELKAFYAAATAIFVGKSLTRKGGQNIIEAAVFGKPVIVGPHTGNFKPVMDDFLRANAVVEVQNDSELADFLLTLLDDKQLRDDYGRRARELIRSKAGVTAATAECILAGILQHSHTA